jgi:hypothetical protein
VEEFDGDVIRLFRPDTLPGRGLIKAASPGASFTLHRKSSLLFL